MATFLHLLFFSSFLFFTFPSIAKTSFRPKSLILPISKHSSSLQYLTRLSQRTPLLPVTLTLDLGGQFFWVDCENGYVSSTYKPIPCRSAKCSLSRSRACVTECYSPPSPGCNNNTCSHLPDNPITRTGTSGELAEDVVSLQSTDGKNPGRTVGVPGIIFVCGADLLLEGLAGGAKGMAGLGRTKVSLPPQFSARFSFARKFSICLSDKNGVMFFGNGPYVLLPNVDVSKSLLYTPLILNPVSTASAYFQGEPSADYFIGVKSIKINGKNVPINTTLLSIDKEGVGGTKLSTVNPYTVMETSVYKAVTDAFVKELANVPRVPSVAPFGACFSSKNIGSTRVGPAVPQIDFVLQSEKVYWRMFGANSMVEVSKEVVCLGFVDGGVEPRTAIVIGGHQMEDNFLEFDLAASKLGFSSSLLFRQTTCSNFNFTSNA